MGYSLAVPHRPGKPPQLHGDLSERTIMRRPPLRRDLGIAFQRRVLGSASRVGNISLAGNPVLLSSTLPSGANQTSDSRGNLPCTCWYCHFAPRI